MPTDDLEGVEGTELAQVSSTERYRQQLIEWLIEATQMSESVMMHMFQGRSDLEGTYALLSRLLHLLIHFEPKVAFGGDKTSDLKKSFEDFKPWIFKPSIPIEDSKEADRIPELFYLIRTCYERFGLTKF